jgi:hypothetical protein
MLGKKSTKRSTDFIEGQIFSSFSSLNDLKSYLKSDKDIVCNINIDIPNTSTELLTSEGRLLA